MCEGLKVQRRRHQRFARTGGRVEDDVLLLEQLQQRLLLRRIQREPASFDVFKEAPEQRVIADIPVARQKFVEWRDHRTRTLLAERNAEK